MTLTNTNKVSFKNSKQVYLNEKFIIFLFSFLPISLILGNTAINLNIIIIDLFFLFICYHQKKWSWIKNKYLYFFIFIWIYLILNSFFSANIITSGIDDITKQYVYPQKESIIRSIGFVRFVIFIFAVQYFFTNSKKVFNKVFLYWTIIISIVLIDIIFERIFGFNLSGFKSPNIFRVVSFFEDELVVGGFVLGFSFLISGLLFKLTKNNLKRKIFSIIFFCLSIICIYLSGERSNFIRALIIASILLLLINDAHFYIKKKYILLFIIIGIAFSTLISKDIYTRQSAFFNRINLPEGAANYGRGSIYKRLGHIRYIAHYDVAWQIFKDYPIFGVGNSKFRYICHNKKYFNAKIIMTNERCSNHPHQVHLEILSEQGVIGYLIIIFVIFNVLYSSFKVFRKTGDITHLSSILFVVTFFIPLLPSGSIFSTFNGSIFWINFSLAHAFLNKSNY